MFKRERRFGRAVVRVTGAVCVLAGAVLTATVPASPASALAACNANAQNSYTMATSHGKVFYIDTGVVPVIDAGYVGYRFTNGTGSTQKNLWASVGNFVGGKMSLVHPDDQYFKLADTASAGTSTAYFMLKSTGGTTTAQSHDVKLWDRRPDLVGATVLYQCTYSFTKVQETIKASSNKVTDNTGDSVAISASTTAPKLGETFQITIEGSTGTVGNGSVPDYSMIWLTPSGLSSWPTRALRLEGVSVIFDANANWNSAGDQTTVTDRLFLANAKSLYNTSEYRATYTFRVIGRPSASVKAVPVTQISSGSQVKHSDTSGAGATVDLNFSSYSIPATVTKTVPTTTGLPTVSCSAGSCSAWGGVDGTTYLLVPYNLTVATSSTVNTSVDELVDVPSVGALYYNDPSDPTRVPKLTDVNNTNTSWGSPVLVDSEASMSPRPRHFVGPFTFRSTRSAVLSYWMALPNVTGTYANTAYAAVGDSPVGTSASGMAKVDVSTTGTTGVGVVTTEQAFPVDVTTSPASSITTTGAVLNGTVDPNGTTPLTAQFEYSTSASMSSPVTVTATTPASGSVGGLTAPTLTAVTLTGLSQFTTYYFRAKAGAVLGQTDSFRTLGTAATPTATTNAAGPTSSTAATLNGTINPNLTTVTGVQFLWGTSPTLASPATITVADSADPTVPMVLAGSSPQVISTNLPAGSIAAGTTYYYMVRACPNGSATMSGYTCGSGQIDGSIVSFTAGTAPTVATTSLPSSLRNAAGYSATLAGTGGSGTYTAFAVSSGSLPTGLVLDGPTGTISGTPTASAGTYTFSVTVTDSLGVTSVARSLSITIITVKINQTITFASVPNQTYSDVPLALAPTADSSLPASLVSTTPTICEAVAAAVGYDVYLLAAGTCSLTAGQTGNSTYNAATDVVRTFTISKRPQSVTFAPTTRTFGDAPFTTVATSDAASEGLTPTYSGGTSGVCSIDTSTGEITVLGAGTCSVQADFPGNARFDAGSSGSVSFTINKRNQSVTFTQSGKTFGDVSFSATATTDATGAGSFSFSSSTGSVCTTTLSGTVSIVGAGDCTLSASHPGNGNWNSGSASVTFAVAKKNQTVTFSPPDRTYGDAAFAPGATTDATGSGSMSVVSSTTSVCVIAVDGKVLVVAAGTCTLTASHPGNGNWNAGERTASFAVAKKNQTVTFSPPDRTYGVPTFAVIASTDAEGGTFSYQSTTQGVCTVNFDDVTVLAAGTCTLKASHTGNQNWNPGERTASFTVNRRGQNISFVPSARSIGDATYDVSGLPVTDADNGGNFTFSGGTPGVCSVASGGVVTLSSVGTCSVTVNHPGNSNWSPGSAVSSFAITNLLSQTLSFSQGSKTFGDPDFDVSATTDATGTGSISFTSSTPSVCTVTGAGRTVILAAGDCTLVASHPGNSTYNSAARSVTFSVGRKNQTVGFSQSSKTYGDSDFSVSATTDASSGSFDFSSGTSGVCTVSTGGVVTIVAAGDCTLTAEHPGNLNYNPGSRSVTFTVNRRNQTVGFSQSSKTYGDADFTVSASTDATGPGSFSYSTSTPSVCTVTGSGSVSVVAAGTCTLSAAHPGNSNWHGGTGGVSFSVNRKNQTVTFSQADKSFGDQSFVLGASTDAGPGSFSYSTSTPSVCTVASDGTVTILDVGVCTSSAAHPGNSNWHSGSGSASFTVGKGSPAITFNPGNRTLGDADFTLVASSTAGSGSLVFSVADASVCSVTSAGTVTLNAEGTCSVTVSHPGDSRWFPATLARSFSVGPRTVESSVAPTTTTVVTTTTTVPKVAASAGTRTGTVTGTMWFDINQNEKMDKNEPVIPNADVELVAAEQVATASSAGSPSVHAESLAFKTDSQGKFLLPAVPVGSYTVRASLPEKWGVIVRLASTSTQMVTVIAAQPLVLDLSAVGTAKVVAVTLDAVTSQPLPRTPVTCAWEGLDGRLGTADDVEFSSRSDAAGAYKVQGVPTGEFSCQARHAVTGATSKTVTTEVSGETSKVALRETDPVRLLIGGAGLVTTGTDTAGLMRWAVALLLLGWVLCRRPARLRR